MFVAVVVCTISVLRLSIWPCFSQFLIKCVQCGDISSELLASSRVLIIGAAVLLWCVVRLVPGLPLLLSVHLVHLPPLLVSLRISPAVVVLLIVAVPLIAVLLIPSLPRVVVLLVLALRRPGVTQSPLVGKTGVPARLIVPLPVLILLGAVVALLGVALIPCIIRSGPVVLVVGVLLCVETCVAIRVRAPAVRNVMSFPPAVGARCHAWAISYEMLRASAAIAPCIRLRPVVSRLGIGWLRLRGGRVFLYCRDFSCGYRRLFFVVLLADCVHASLTRFHRWGSCDLRNLHVS